MVAVRNVGYTKGPETICHGRQQPKSLTTTTDPFRFGVLSIVESSAMRVSFLVLAGAQLAGAFQITPSSFTSNTVVGGRHASCAAAAGSRADMRLAPLRLAMRDGVSGEANVASARRMALEKGAAGALALVLGANPLLAAEGEEEVEEVEAPAKEPTKPREVTFKATDKTCDDHPTWKKCRYFLALPQAMSAHHYWVPRYF